jgi:hypothetical protein
MTLREKTPEVGKAVRVRLAVVVPQGNAVDPWRAAYLEVAGETTHHYAWRMLGQSVPAKEDDEWEATT